MEGEIADPHGLELRAFVNGELRQRANTRQFLHKVPELIEFITSFMTLEPGDILLTGTPRGVSHVHPGDVMRLEIDGIGALENAVVAEPQDFSGAVGQFDIKASVEGNKFPVNQPFSLKVER